MSQNKVRRNKKAEEWCLFDSCPPQKNQTNLSNQRQQGLNNFPALKSSLSRNPTQNTNPFSIFSSPLFIPNIYQTTTHRAAFKETKPSKTFFFWQFASAKWVLARSSRALITNSMQLSRKVTAHTNIKIEFTTQRGNGLVKPSRI